MLTNKVSDMTVDELRGLIRETVRQTLSEILADPDDGLELQDGIENTLRHSIKAIRDGAPTYTAGDVAEKLGLNW
ncbi:MAG: hypothetical protein DCC56_12695 [Anaerolineae bacterium]|nr:MAG: hypothetical protein DCC56_12695 [Anaerolineae bacterium]WKZ43029.1 MAG: hypothetical protein QY302_13085 [Anaerolineales bacterium]